MANDLTGLNSLRQALTPYDDVKFELNLNRHPKAHKNKSIVYAKNMKLSKDGAVLENEESIVNNKLIKDSLEAAYPNGYSIIHIIPCNTELVLFITHRGVDDSDYFHIWRYREQTSKYNEDCAIFYDYDIKYHNGNFSGTFTYTSNDSLIIAFCEYDSSDNTIMNPMMTINLGTFTDGYNDKDTDDYWWNSNIGEFNDRALEPYKLPICPEVSLPQITNVSNIKGNSYIGTYYVYIRYKINKYDYTQWFNIGYPIINEFKQDTIIHQKVTINDKNKSDANYDTLIGTNKTSSTIKLNTYVNQNVDLINNCINVSIEHNNILYDYCQIGFICISKTYTKYFVTSDIKLVNSINVSTNIDKLKEEIFNTNIYENYYNVKNIINKNNKLYISNYKTFISKDIDTNEVDLSLIIGNTIVNNYEDVTKQNDTITINDIDFNLDRTISVKYDWCSYPETTTILNRKYFKFVSLAYYLKEMGLDNNITSKTIASITTPNDDSHDLSFYNLNIEDLYISVKKVKIKAELIEGSNEDITYTLVIIGMFRDSSTYWSVRQNYLYDQTTLSGTYSNFRIQNLYIDFGNGEGSKNITGLFTKETIDIYPEKYLENKVYYNNALDNKINNNIVTGLCQGEVYDFYIHFIDKYGYITDGYKIKGKNIGFKYDFYNDGNPLDVCFIIHENNTFIVPSEDKLFLKDENDSINSNIRPRNIKKLNDNPIPDDITIITDDFIDNSFSPIFITGHIANNLDGLKYLPEDILLNLTIGDIFDEEPILYDNVIKFIPYYNSQNELFFKVPKLISSEGDIQLGLKVEIGDITNYGDYVSYFISHKKLEKTYVLNGVGTKNQLNNILLNNKFESGNIVKLYDIKSGDNWDSDLYDKCTLQQNIIFKNGFTLYTNLLNKLAYAQDSQNNRADRQTTLYLSDSIVEFNGVPRTDDIENGIYGVKYLELLNLDRNKYINNKVLYRLGNIEYGNCIINKGLNGRYDKHLAIKYGNENEGVNNILSDTGIGSYGDVNLYELFGFFDFNDLGIYLSEKAKSHKIFKDEYDLGTDTFYEVITTLNLFNYKISNIYDTWINFYNVFDKDNDYLKEFNRTIYRSAVISDEGRTNNWRWFENDAYKNIEENKGNITNLLAIGNYLYVHTEHSLFAFSEDNTLSMNNQNLQVATPDIFDTEYKEVFITKLGYGGLQDKDAWIAGQFGYIWFDGDSKKIFKVYGNSMDIISNDIQEWLENAEIYYVKFANDIKNNRILIYFNIWDSNTDDKNIIISYNILSKTFISFHDYYWENSYNTKNNLYYLRSNIITQYNEDNYGGNGMKRKQYSVSFIINSYYREIKYLEHISFKLRQRNIRNINNSFGIITDYIQFPVEKELLPFQPKSIRVYNDLVDTDSINCDSIDEDTGMPKNNIEDYQTPYWDLGNWNLSFLRDVEHYPNADYDIPNARLFGNYFVISFNFGYVNTLIEFENLDVQLTKDKEL